MWSQIKKQLTSITKYSPTNRKTLTGSLVTLIINLITNNIGLCINKATHKVTWTSRVTTVCFVTSCALQAVALVLAREDPDRLFECFSVLAFTGMGLLKLSSFLIYPHRWKFILDEMSKLEIGQLHGCFTSHVDYQSDDEEHINFSSHISKYSKKFKSTSAILKKIYSFTAIIFILSPFLEYSFHRLNGKDGLKYPHILPGWAPLDATIYGYLITVSCEFVSSVYCVCVHIAFDVTNIGIMIFVCGQFSLLRKYSELIAGRGVLCNISEKRDARARFRIELCHRTNLLVVNMIKELDKLLKNIIGLYFFLATLTLCSVAVQLKSQDMSVMQVVSLLQYMGATLTQLFLFCRYGDAVLNEIVRTAYSYYAVIGQK